MNQPRTEQFTTWTQDFAERLNAAAGALLGFDGGRVVVSPRADARPGLLGRLVVFVELPDGASVGLELSEVVPGRSTWLSHHGLGVSYRRGRDGADPMTQPAARRFLDGVRQRVTSLTPEALARSVAGFIRALEAAERGREVGDWMYRQLSMGIDGHYGTLRLGFRCNQDCGFCWQSRTWPEPELDVFMRWLDEMAAAGVGELTVTGGEPTLYKGLPQLLERAIRVHGMRVQLQTNAIRLRKAAFVQQLVDTGLEWLFVSLHSPDPTVSDRMTRAPGTWQGTVAGVEQALAHGLRVQLNCVVERANLAQLRDHARFVVERFVRPTPNNPIVSVTYSNPCSYYDASLWQDAVAPLDEVGPEVRAATAILAEAGVAVDVVGSSCGFPPCVFREAPEFIVWADRAEFDTMDVSGRFFPPECDGCAVRDRCLGVRREYYELRGGAGLRPFDSVPEEAREHSALGAMFAAEARSA